MELEIKSILLYLLLLTERVVLVVFVGPPDGKEARRQCRKMPKSVAPGIDSVDVIVSQPSGRRHAQGERNRRQTGIRSGQDSTQRHQAAPNAQELSLVVDVALPPAVGFQLVEQLSKGDLRIAVGFHRLLELGDGFGLGLREAGEHLAGLLRMKGVHYLGSITAVVPIDPVISGGVGLSPAWTTNRMPVKNGMQTKRNKNWKGT